MVLQCGAAGGPHVPGAVDEVLPTRQPAPRDDRLGGAGTHEVLRERVTHEPVERRRARHDVVIQQPAGNSACVNETDPTSVFRAKKVRRREPDMCVCSSSL